MVHIPLLSPQQLATHTSSWQQGHHHLPQKLEEIYIRGGKKFIFNRGKSYLFVLGNSTVRNVQAEVQSWSNRVPDFVHPRSNFDDNDAALHFLEQYLGQMQPRGGHSGFQTESPSFSRLVDFDCGHSNCTPRLEDLKRALIDRSIDKTFENSGCPLCNTKDLEVKIEVLNILTTPSLVLGIYEMQTKQKMLETNATIGNRKHKTTPILKENDLQLRDRFGNVFGLLSIAITVDFFRKNPPISCTQCKMPKPENKKHEFYFQNANIDQRFLVNKGPALETAVVSMILESNRKWANQILYENPYAIRLNSMKFDKNEFPTSNVRKIGCNGLTCYLESNYKEKNELECDVPSRRSGSAETSAVIRGSTIRPSSQKTKEHQKLATRNKGTNTSETETKSIPKNAQSAGKYPSSKIRHSMQDSGKKFDIVKATSPPRRGWLRSTPVSAMSHRIIATGSKGRVSGVKLTRTCFLRRSLVDPEIQKQIKKEVDNKLNFQLRILDGEINKIRRMRPKSKPRSSKTTTTIGNQTDVPGQSTADIYWHFEDKETMVGDSLLSITNQDRTNNRSNLNGTLKSDKTSKNLKCKNPNFSKNEDLKPRRGLNLLDKDIETVLSKFNSSQSSHASSEASSVGNKPIANTENMRLETVQRSRYLNENTNEIHEKENQDSLNRTYTISKENLGDNIRNASELDSGNVTNITATMNSFESYDKLLSEDKFNSMYLIEEQTEEASGGASKSETLIESVCEEIEPMISENFRKQIPFPVKLYSDILSSSHSSLEESISEELEHDSNSAADPKKENSQNPLNNMESFNQDHFKKQILGSNVNLGVADSTINDSQEVLKASATFSWGQIMEDVAGVDFNRDSSYSSKDSPVHAAGPISKVIASSDKDQRLHAKAVGTNSTKQATPSNKEEVKGKIMSSGTSARKKGKVLPGGVQTDESTNNRDVRPDDDSISDLSAKINDMLLSGGYDISGSDISNDYK